VKICDSLNRLKKDFMKTRLQCNVYSWLFFIAILLLSCDKNRENKEPNLPPPFQNTRQVGTCEVPQNYPYVFEPTLAVKNGTVMVGYIGLSSSPFAGTTDFTRRVFFTNLNTTISPAAQQFGDVSTTGGADPVLVFDSEGLLNALNLVNYEVNGMEVNSMQFTKIDPATNQVVHSTELAISDNTNTTWPHVAGDPDKCWMTINPMNGAIYIAWSELDDINGEKATIYFTQSTDGGTTFSTAVRITTDDKDNFYVQLASLPNGNILLLWDVRGEGVIKSSVSVDQGVTFSAPEVVFTNPSSKRNDQLMVLSLTQHADDSLTLSVTIVDFSSQGEETSRSIALNSADGIAWQPLGSAVENATFTSVFYHNNTYYMIGYYLQNTTTGFYIWKLTQTNTWEPYSIKATRKNGWSLSPGDYVGSVLENGIIYSAFTWDESPDGRKVYVTKTTL
jgi:hypothetical protein